MEAEEGFKKGISERVTIQEIVKEIILSNLSKIEELPTKVQHCELTGN